MVAVRLTERDSPKGAENVGGRTLMDLRGAAAWQITPGEPAGAVALR